MTSNKNELWNNYMKYRTDIYQTLLPSNVGSSLISEANWMIRGRCASGEQIGIFVKPGDIVYMDYGQSYLNEAGYQHFGLVISLCCRKALVVPMTSNPKTYENAYDPETSPEGSRHLMRLGQIRGMNKPSVLFLNDLRYVNTARVIDVKSHISTRSRTFREVKERLKDIMF